jgi:hypothetical protein
VSTQVLLQLEGAVALALCLWAYAANSGSWLLFGVLFFVPDVSMIGYARNARLGSIVYNVVHTYAGPFALTAIAILLRNAMLLSVGTIWLAHISFDRTLGYGLKRPTRFNDTHLATDRL